MNNKQAILQNNGHEELSINDILLLGGLNPTNKLVEHNSQKYVPRKMPNYFIPQINHYSRAKDGLLTCLVIENNNKKYFYSPSMTLFATIQRKDAQGIREILGQNDNLNQFEQTKINQIIKYIRAGNSLSELRKITKNKTGIINKYGHIEKKRLENILETRLLEDVLFNGHAYNGKIPSKESQEFYNVSQKQLIKYNNGKIIVPDSLQASCTCGFGQASFLKYEFEEIVSKCSHVELLRQTLSNPSLGKRVRLQNKYGKSKINNIENIFSPFSPLDYPEKNSEEVRAIIRNGLYNFIVPQEYIRNNFDDSHNYHKSNGFTFFRCELDAFLLSFEEIFNPEFFAQWKNNINQEASELYTSQFFGDYQKTGEFIEVNAEHVFDETTKRLNHFVNGNWKKVEHLGIDKTNNIEGLLQPNQIIHDNKNNYEHKIKDKSITNNLEITHVIEEQTPFIDFRNPFQVGVFDNGVKAYLRPYQMRDSK